MRLNSTFRARIPGELPLSVFLISMCAALALGTEAFVSAGNLKVLRCDAAAVGIMSVGMKAVVVTGGIDLSVAAVLAMSALVGGAMIAQGNVAVGCAAALAGSALSATPECAEPSLSRRSSSRP